MLLKFLQPQFMNVRNKLECLPLTILGLWVRPGAYTKVDYPKGVLLWLASALLTNIRLHWKCLPVTNALAYNEDL
jgi:hypothetical protein